MIKDWTGGNSGFYSVNHRFLESAKRYNFFKKYPPKYVYVYVNRQGCGKGTDNFKNSGAAAYCMYVWQKEIKNEPIIRWIN